MKTIKNIVMKGWHVQVHSEHPSCQVTVSCENGAIVERVDVESKDRRLGNVLAYRFASQSNKHPVIPELPVHVQVEKWDIELTITPEGHLDAVFTSELNHPVGLLTFTNGNSYAPACTFNMEIEQTGMFSVAHAGMTLTVYCDADGDSLFPSIYSPVAYNEESLKTIVKIAKEQAVKHGYYCWNEQKGQFWCQGVVVGFDELMRKLRI